MSFKPQRRKTDELIRGLWPWLRGVLVAIGIVTVASFMLLTSFLSQLSEDVDKNMALPNKIVLNYTLDAGLSEKISKFSFDRPFFETSFTLRDVISVLHKAKDDKRVTAFVLRIKNIEMSLAQIQELRNAVNEFRKSGKSAMVYAEDFNTMSGYYLASAFDEIWMQPVSSVAISGLAVEVPFFKEALNKLGVNAEFSRKGAYKSSPESLTESKMSDKHREMMTALVGDLSEQFLADISFERKISVEKLKAYMDVSPYSDTEALDLKLVDKLVYFDDELDKYFKKAGLNMDSWVSFSGYILNSEVVSLNLKEMLDDGKKPATKKKIALITGEGSIVSHKHRASMSFGEDNLVADKISENFDDAIEDEDVAVIVFRINSPGGSPSASETIRYSILKAQKKGKPVIVSMSGTAASGAYWIASAADKIVAQPATITGSIGVFGGKFVFKTLWDKIGLNWERIKSSDNAGMWSPNKSFSAKEKARFEAMLDSIYEHFINRVMSGRKMTREEVLAVAEGRVWTGRQAKEHGLVDELGGFNKAIEMAKIAIGKKAEDNIPVEEFPGNKSPAEMFIDFMFDSAFALPNLDAQSLMKGLKSLEYGALEMPNILVVD